MALRRLCWGVRLRSLTTVPTIAGGNGLGSISLIVQRLEVQEKDLIKELYEVT